ncbi:leucine-rich repeat domain-containing protein [Ohtaekwangia kribbensis]|jgi:Leucine-rich repeat (LRR) protein|uniref:Leucine-rich repeat domain-containing protein n=1 Tax=Ohtaekwangia kribbensis TaxID=688913 RepID=A0ABW3KA77_9BACT
MNRIDAALFPTYTCLLVLCFSFAIGQPSITRNRNLEVPVYKSPQDSVRLANVNALYDKLHNDERVDLKILDSVENLRDVLREQAILRFRILYKPSPDFTPYDSLTLIRDLRKVKRVSIIGLQLKELPSILLRCDSLQSIELVNCSIRKIQKQINQLPRLTSIAILNNTYKRPLRLNKNDRITLLAIHGDHARALPRSYRKLKALETLDLSNNALVKFPNGAARNRKLKELSLQHNELTLRDKLKLHPNLEKLALQFNRIQQVPDQITRFPNLTRLSLNHNRITNVTPAIGSLKKLKHLSFYNNRLTSVPTGVYELRSLNVIDLYFNQIEAIDDRISNWDSLQILFISHNKLLKLPEKLTTLRLLEELYAYDNRLTSISDDINQLSKLRIIYVQNNCLRQIPNTLLQLDSLEEMDFSENYMTDLPETIFNYPKLRFISLMNNPWRENVRLFIDRKSKELAMYDITVRVSGPRNSFH